MAFGIESSSGSAILSTSLTFSHTLTAADLMVGQVGTGATAIGDRTVSSITYNAVGMTIKGAADDGNFTRATIAELDVTGVTGAHNVVISMGGTALIGGGVTGFTNASVTTFGTVATNHANDSSPTVTAVSASGEILVAVVASDANVSVTEGAGGTQLWKTNAIGGDCSFGGEWYTGAASVTATYSATTPDTGWAMVAMSIKPAGGSNNTQTPSGFAIPMSLGTPAILSSAITKSPAGYAIPISLGTPSINTGSNPTVTPTGFSSLVQLGSFTTQADITITGISGYVFPATLGTPTVNISSGSNPTITPTGFAATVQRGTPLVTLTSTKSPTGFSALMQLGTPQLALTTNIGPIGFSTPVQLGTPTILGPVGGVAMSSFSLGLGLRLGIR